MTIRFEKSIKIMDLGIDIGDDEDRITELDYFDKDFLMANILESLDRYERDTDYLSNKSELTQEDLDMLDNIADESERLRLAYNTISKSGDLPLEEKGIKQHQFGFGYRE